MAKKRDYSGWSKEELIKRVEALEKRKKYGLVHYNTKRPHLGYRNMGRRPVETIDLFLNKNV